MRLKHYTMIGTAIAAALALPAFAQTADAPADAAVAPSVDATTVVVTGFRKSYADALRSKRTNIEITDGISSDGLGRFPDLNVGEALQRVPGVQINREAEGRNATINLRGMPGEYARLTMNGQAFAEPILGDAAPLGAFNSDIFSAIMVEKSPMANAQTGGLSGNLDLQIAPALSRKDGGTFKVGYEYNALGDLGSPAYTIGYNKHITPTFAVFGVLAYKKEKFRRDSVLFNGYGVLAPGNSPTFLADYKQYYSPAACVSGSAAFCNYTPGATGTTATTGVYYDSQLRQYSRMNEGDTYTAAYGAEWKPNDQTKVGLTGFYTNRDQPKTRQDLLILSQTPTSTITPLSAPQKLSDGRYIIQDYTYTNADILYSTRNYAQHQETWGFNGNLDWRNDKWRSSTIAHLSKGSNSSQEVEVDIDRIVPASGINGTSGTFHSGNGEIEDFAFTLNPVPAASFATTSGWYWGGINDPTNFYDAALTNTAARTKRLQLTGTLSYAENETKSVQSDLERYFDHGFLTSLQGGVRVERNSYRSEGYRIMAYGLKTQNITTSMLETAPYVSDFFGNQGGDYTKNWGVVDMDAFLTAVTPVDVFPGGALDPLGFNIRYNDDNFALRNYSSTTDVDAAYLQAKYETSLAGVRIRGNAGLRYEQTEVSLEVLDRKAVPSNGIGSPNDFKLEHYSYKYHYWLPSAIFVADLRDNLLLRGAAYRTYVRPHPRQFSPVTRIGTPTTINAGTPTEQTNVGIQLGNNNLRPYTADSIDLSLEWYNRPNGVVSLAIFQKRITGRIAGISDPAALCPADGSNWGFGTLVMDGDRCKSETRSTPTAPYYVNASGTSNIDDPTTVTGVEFNVQQNLDFLPSFWKNFGGSFNYAYTTSEGKLNGVNAPFPGISKHNVNLIGYYETSQFGVRMVYNYRTSYDLNSAGTFTGGARSVRPRGQLDLSASYNLNAVYSIAFDAYNLTDAIRQEYENQENLPRRADYDGRTYTVTLRGTF